MPFTLFEALFAPFNVILCPYLRIPKGHSQLSDWSYLALNHQHQSVEWLIVTVVRSDQ